MTLWRLTAAIIFAVTYYVLISHSVSGIEDIQNQLFPK